ncbi:MAG: hypothetical protein U0359_29485 [Byssovorax sp.]
MKRTALSFGVALLFAAGCMGGSPVEGDNGAVEGKTGSAKQAVQGAAFTTFDVDVQGCLNGTNPNGVNCNLYSSKQSVYMNGGPGPSALENGTYFFAVLTPGAQNAGFLDGAEGNLSDTTAHGNGDDGSGDDVSNRTFSIADGVITYSGTHANGSDPQGSAVVGLFPFDDTDNPGGEYILAICTEGATDPSECKYDAFKVKTGGCESAADCDDGNPCTTDVCGSDGSCSHAAGNAGAVCRAAAGACDTAEVCTGDSTECPADGKSSGVCRPAAGPCDAPESCDGASNDCPADGFLSSATVCRDAAGACDVAESCTGSSADCPADAKSTDVCRASAGVCDVAESCDGVSNDCPADGFLSAATVCRDAAGACDLAESCTGSSADCPADAKSTAECRGAAGECDVPESCDGVGNDCPADQVKPINTACSSDGSDCTADLCDGSSAACQHPAQIHGHKRYDHNVDGDLGGEAGVAGWQIKVNGVAVASTDASGAYSYFPGFGASGSFTVCEGSSSGWVATTSTCQVVDLGNACSVDFGNVCLGAGGGLTLGFWSNKNGQALITADDLAALSALNLRDAMGSNYDPLTKLSLRTWLLNGTAVNMAYMLSVQLTAMDLNVRHGFVQGSALIYAPGTQSANSDGFASVSAIIAEANAALGADGYTIDGNQDRAYQEALKNALDKANNNLNFLQSGPASCAAPTFN